MPNLPTARLSKDLATKAHIGFTTAREWNVFLLLVAQLDPLYQNRFNTAILPMNLLLKALDIPSRKSGSVYQQVRDCSRKMIKATCEFESEIEADGEVLPKFRTIFSKIDPKKTPGGMVYIEYQFNELMKPFLLGFKKNFMGITPPVWIKCGHSIRFLILAKAQRDAERAHRKVTELRFSVAEFRRIMGLTGKYAQFKDLKKRVIKPILSSMETIPYLNVAYEQVKIGRSINQIIFRIEDGNTTHKLDKSVQQIIEFRTNELEHQDENTLPTDKELHSLTMAQAKAYEFLVEQGIFSGIAYRTIIPRMPSSECAGFEDYFCEEAYKVVKKKSKAKSKKDKAAVFVSWFQSGVFKDDQFSEIIEAVVKRKKDLSLNHPDAWANRQDAKNRTYAEFVESYRIEQVLEQKTFQEMTTDYKPKEEKGFESLGEIFKKVKMT